MDKPINVIVFKPADRPYFHAQWTDPLTGKKRTESLKTAIRRDAERLAGDRERELRERRNPPPGSVTWEMFKERYIEEVVPGLAPRTGAKVDDMFAVVNRYLAPATLSAVGAPEVSTFTKLMRADKRSENTIRSHLGHLRAALNWAESVHLIGRAPKVKLPKQQSAARHRAPTGEEFDRLLAAIPKALFPDPAERKEPRKYKCPAPSDEVLAARPGIVASWEWLLRGLWWSGLRSSEALQLSWDDDRLIKVQLDGRFPMMWIPARLQKNRRNTLIPMAPELAQMLQEVPSIDRTGFVFNPLPRAKRKQGRLAKGFVEKMIGEIGERAKVLVSLDDKPAYATAHDLRRAFGFRWSQRVMPAVLKEMMRHSSINTTMQFYALSTAEATASTIWDAHKSAGSTNTNANTSHSERSSERKEKVAKPND